MILLLLGLLSALIAWCSGALAANGVYLAQSSGWSITAASQPTEAATSGTAVFSYPAVASGASFAMVRGCLAAAPQSPITSYLQLGTTQAGPLSAGTSSQAWSCTNGIATLAVIYTDAAGASSMALEWSSYRWSAYAYDSLMARPVAGSVNVGNFPATQAVSGSVSASNLPLDGAGNVKTKDTGAQLPFCGSPTADSLCVREQGTVSTSGGSGGTAYDPAHPQKVTLSSSDGSATFNPQDFLMAAGLAVFLLSALLVGSWARRR